MLRDVGPVPPEKIARVIAMQRKRERQRIASVARSGTGGGGAKTLSTLTSVPGRRGRRSTARSETASSLPFTRSRSATALLASERRPSLSTSTAVNEGVTGSAGLDFGDSGILVPVSVPGAKEAEKARRAEQVEQLVNQSEERRLRRQMEEVRRGERSIFALDDAVKRLHREGRECVTRAILAPGVSSDTTAPRSSQQAAVVPHAPAFRRQVTIPSLREDVPPANVSARIWAQSWLFEDDVDDDDDDVGNGGGDDGIDRDGQGEGGGGTDGGGDGGVHGGGESGVLHPGGAGADGEIAGLAERIARMRARAEQRRRIGALKRSASFGDVVVAAAALTKEPRKPASTSSATSFSSPSSEPTARIAPRAHLRRFASEGDLPSLRGGVGRGSGPRSGGVVAAQPAREGRPPRALPPVHRGGGDKENGPASKTFMGPKPSRSGGLSDTQRRFIALQERKRDLGF